MTERAAAFFAEIPGWGYLVIAGLLLLLANTAAIARQVGVLAARMPDDDDAD